MAFFLLAVCLTSCLPDTRAQHWKLVSYFEVDYESPLASEELMIAEEILASEEERSRLPSLDRMRSAFYRQIGPAHLKLQRHLRRRLLNLGWVKRRIDTETPVFRLHYEFTRFTPAFRTFRPMGFFTNLWNPLPGAAILGAFPLTGGQYELQVSLYNCADRLIERFEVGAAGLSALEEMAGSLVEKIRLSAPTHAADCGRLPNYFLSN